MDPSARVPSAGPVLFQDGFGQRRLVAGTSGDQFEALTLRDELIASPVVEAALRVHPQAWWDGENLKKRVLGDPAKMEEFCVLLQALPKGFNLKLHDWKKDHWCSAAKASELKEMFQHYTPGNHWLHVQRQLPKDDAVGMGLDAEAWVRTSLLALLPLYKFTLWDPDGA